MIEVILTICGLGFYVIGGLIVFLVEAFRLRGKEFSNEHTQGMHYTNAEAVEAAALYALMWPAYILMHIASFIGATIARIE